MVKKQLTLNVSGPTELPHTLIVSEVAMLCSMTHSNIHLWLSAGKLRGRWTGTIWLIDRDDLLKYAKKNGIVLSFSKQKRDLQP